MQRWQRIHLQEPAYTACGVCLHGPRGSSELCRHPDLAGEPSQAIKNLRAVGGACGIEAEHLVIPEPLRTV